MLHLYFRSINRMVEIREFIEYPDDLVDSIWEPEWVNNHLSRAIIQDIDKIKIPDGVTTEMADIANYSYTRNSNFRAFCCTHATKKDKWCTIQTPNRLYPYVLLY